VLGNDTLNGVAVSTNNTNVTPITTGAILIDIDGNVTIAANTPTGSYAVAYTICESVDAANGSNVSPANCTTATVTVNVVGKIVAVDDTYPMQIPSTTVTTIVGSVLTSNGNEADTLNGVAVTIENTNVIATTVGPLSIDKQGVLTLAPNTPAATYSIPYTICETGVNPANCSTATATVIVGVSKLEAIDNRYSTPISGVAGGDTGLNVFGNDLQNGEVLDPTKVFLAPVTKGPLTIKVDGSIYIAPNTPAGLYDINYTICEVINPTNCSTALVSVIVEELPSIAIVKTAVFNDINGDGYAQAGETITYSFEVTNTGNVSLSNVTVIDALEGLVLSGNPIAVLGIGEVNSTAYTGVYKLTQADINFGSVSNQAIVEGTSVNGVVVSDLSDEMSKADDQPTVLGVQGCVIEVFNAVAPNGNGDNKVFRIRGLECYPDNTVEIYNRWGVLVFERSAYNNDDRAFRGVSEGRVTINQSEQLPEGTYYYILRYKDSAGILNEKSGYLYINR
jgi:gliding motility-associated-like protein